MQVLCHSVVLGNFRGSRQVTKGMRTAACRAALRQWIEALEERDAVEAHYQATIFDMKSTLEERIKRADDIARVRL